MSIPSQRRWHKLTLPTVETCPYRRLPPGAATAARCELLQMVSGVTIPDLCQVESDACQACCESFPPTIDAWNPVVASLLFGLAERVVAQGGVSGCSAAQAVELQQAVTNALDVAPSPQSHIIPNRVTSRCWYLGDPLNSETGTESFACRHPKYQTTTVDHCHRCRDWTSAAPVSRILNLQEMVPPPSQRQGPRVGSWSVGVLTAPRREATLEWCLDSIVRAGWERPRLFVDGLVRIPERYSHLPVTWREDPAGAWPNYYLALSELIQRDPHADAYVLFQDDAVLYDRGNLREYLETVLWPGADRGLVSLYCSQAYNSTQPGWHQLVQRWVWGALGIIFPRELAREFVTDPMVCAHRWNGPREGRSMVDVLIGDWVSERGYSISYPNPSLIQHVGNTSSIWNGAVNAGWRRADWFAGDLETPFAAGTSLADFAEGLFPCGGAFQDAYSRRVEAGRTRMAQRRLVICGLCRDVRHFLPRFAARVERLGGQFKDYRVVLYENDSHDSTLEFLQDWQRANSRVHVLTETLGNIRYPQVRSSERAIKMAEYRNRCQRFAVDHYGDFDDVLITDTDLAGGWSYDGLANTFGHDDWDFVGSYGLIRRNRGQLSDLLQFDAWAFRAVGHPQPHSNIEINSMVFERGEPLLPVLSCFGGMAVYRMQAWMSAEYGGPDTEHAVLHDRMRRQGYGRMFLNPSQIALYSPE